ncbi:unnamed protein product, partial [marine sediment metagenome]
QSIIQSIIHVDKLILNKFKRFQEDYVKLQKKAISYGMDSKATLSFYPFNPATLYYLGFISEYSNATRTALKFVHNITKEFLKKPIILKNPHTNKESINIINPDSLWDYFSEEISNIFPLRSLTLAY